MSAVLKTMQERFAYMAKARREVATKWLDRGMAHAAAILRSRAECYERCARELERAAAGETPPAAGEDWPDPMETQDRG